jgi:hypothetical protein
MPPDASGRSDIQLFARFVARVVGKVALVLAIPFAATAIYVHCLHAVGELLPPQVIAELSVSANRILWLTGYYDTALLHKLDVAKRIAPEIAVIGSSRVMQVRARFFNKLEPRTFYNLGGCCSSAIEAQRAIHALTEGGAQRPKIVLLGVDSWWFESAVDGQSRRRALAGPFGPTLATHVTATSDVLSGVADRLQVLQQAWRDPRFQEAAREHFEAVRDPSVNALLVGVSARVNRSGFRNDGSYRYGKLIATEEAYGADSSASAQHARDFRQATMIDIARRPGLRGRYMSPDYIHIFESIVSDAKTSGIQLIVFMVPIAPMARDYLDSRAETRDLTSRVSTTIASICAQNAVPFLDEFDGRDLNARDDDFYDWAHPSERLVARVIERLFNDSKAGPILAPYGDPAAIQADLAASQRRWQLYDF